jgi:fructose-1,6-bisphosphatase/inositol monophosphatase family enzyme
VKAKATAAAFRLSRSDAERLLAGTIPPESSRSRNRRTTRDVRSNDATSLAVALRALGKSDGLDTRSKTVNDSCAGQATTPSLGHLP